MKKHQLMQTGYQDTLIMLSDLEDLPNTRDMNMLQNKLTKHSIYTDIMETK